MFDRYDILEMRFAKSGTIIHTDCSAQGLGIAKASLGKSPRPDLDQSDPRRCKSASKHDESDPRKDVLGLKSWRRDPI